LAAAVASNGVGVDISGAIGPALRRRRTSDSSLPPAAQ